MSFLTVLDTRLSVKEQWSLFRLMYCLDLRSFLKSDKYDKLLSLKQKLILKRDQLMIHTLYNKLCLNVVDIEDMSEEELDFIKIFAFIGDSEQINTFLIAIITDSMVFGDIEWTQVSKELNAIKSLNKSQSTVSHMSAIECQKYFKQVIARYLFVLTVSDSQSMASKMWSFFPIIHSIDFQSNF